MGGSGLGQKPRPDIPTDPRSVEEAKGTAGQPTRGAGQEPTRNGGREGETGGTGAGGRATTE